jgi:hypothetical protein
MLRIFELVLPSGQAMSIPARNDDEAYEQALARHPQGGKLMTESGVFIMNVIPVLETHTVRRPTHDNK